MKMTHALMVATIVLSMTLWSHAGQGVPLVIAWQAPLGPSVPGWNPTPCNNTTGPPCYNCPGGSTNFSCFLTNVLPNISGIGFVVPWGLIDQCSLSGPCESDDTCVAHGDCYSWSWVDAALMHYVSATTVGGSNTWLNGCAGGRPCKIVMIIWLTQDSGGTNLYANQPNTPAYVFSQAWADTVYAGTGCGSLCAPQDVLVCKDWQGGGTTGWGGSVPITDSCWPNGGANEYGLWNVQGAHQLQSLGGCMMAVSNLNNFANYSGYPVMYERPILKAAEDFIAALALHYSSNCPNATSCGNGPQIAHSIAYMRIGPSSGGEDYPYCASNAPTVYTGSCNIMGSFWSGPQGYALEPQCFSDQGYLTSWPMTVDGTGYISSLYHYISQRNWAFPITTPSHNGPPNDSSVIYTDTEALLANQYGLGMGMQAATIGDPVTYAIQYSPSTQANWAVHFREFPYVPVHHLQTENPGAPVQAAQFSFASISTVGLSASSALVTCGSGCNNFCDNPPWVFVSGTNIPAFNGIQEVDLTNTCTSTSFYITSSAGSFPTSATSGAGLVYSGAHLPVLLPFESQQCQGSAQTTCSAELWEETLDWTYGTNTTTGTTGNAGYGDSAYQAAISNFLVGLPSATSVHNNMSTNAAIHY